MESVSRTFENSDEIALFLSIFDEWSTFEADSGSLLFGEWMPLMKNGSETVKKSTFRDSRTFRLFSDKIGSLRISCYPRVATRKLNFVHKPSVDSFN